MRSAMFDRSVHGRLRLHIEFERVQPDVVLLRIGWKRQ